MSAATPIRSEAVGTGSPEVSAIALEPLYTPQQVADYLHLDTSSVRRILADRPGIVVIGRATARGGKRSYSTLRIPLSVLRDFLAERTKGKAVGRLSRTA